MPNSSRESTFGIYTTWWHWVRGTDWRHPAGPESGPEGSSSIQPSHPVDAMKSCCIPRNPRGARLEDSYDPCQPTIQIPRRVLKGIASVCATRHAVRHLLHDYVDVRVLSLEERRNPQQVLQAVTTSRQIQAKFWQHAEAAAGEAPNDITATFIETLNTLIDADTAHAAASRNRIPSGLWLILIVVAAIGCWTTTYGAGATNATASSA